jgi:SseB protein N-terminal domain
LGGKTKWWGSNQVATLIEAAILSYTSNRSDATLQALDSALVQDNVLVPVSAEVTAIGTGNYDVPVICIKTSAGDGAIPAFTSIEQLLKWKPEGCKYVTMTGKSLLEMAIEMPVVAEIVVNVEGSPRGVIPRSEFGRLIAQH